MSGLIQAPFDWSESVLGYYYHNEDGRVIGRIAKLSKQTSPPRLILKWMIDPSRSLYDIGIYYKDIEELHDEVLEIFRED